MWIPVQQCIVSVPTDIFQLTTTLILTTCIVFLDGVLSALCRNVIRIQIKSISSFVLLRLSLIQSFILKLWQTQRSVQRRFGERCNGYKGRSRRAAPRAHTLPGQGPHSSSRYTAPPHTQFVPPDPIHPPSLVLEQPEPCPPLRQPFPAMLCASRRAGQGRPGTALATEIYRDALCNTGESPGGFLLCFHRTLTEKAGPDDEWQVLQSWANKLTWQIKCHRISRSMTVPGIICTQAGRDDISDSFRVNKRKGRSPTVRRKE